MRVVIQTNPYLVEAKVGSRTISKKANLTSNIAKYEFTRASCKTLEVLRDQKPL